MSLSLGGTSKTMVLPPVVVVVVVVVVLGYLCAVPNGMAEARGVGDLAQDEIDNYERSIQQAQQLMANGQLPLAAAAAAAAATGGSSSLDRLDSDDDEDDDDRAQLQPAPESSGMGVQQAGSNLHHQTGESPYHLSQLAVGDLGMAASKYHGHKHGAKGWLDMGAWTGKKGAFGWYDKHPVGKGK